MKCLMKLGLFFVLFVFACPLFQSCKNDCVSAEGGLECNLKVLDAMIDLESIEGNDQPKLWTTPLPSGELLCRGTSIRKSCKNGLDVAGNIFGIIRPIKPSGGGIFISEEPTVVNVNNRWSKTVNVQGNSGDVVEILFILIKNDENHVNFVKEIAKNILIETSKSNENPIPTLNTLRSKLDQKDIYFKESNAFEITLK